MAHLNCRGINEVEKRNIIEAWAIKKKVKIITITETQHPHTSQEGGKEKRKPTRVKRGGKYKWYFSSGIDPTKKHAALEEANKTKKKNKNPKSNSSTLGVFKTLSNKLLKKGVTMTKQNRKTITPQEQQGR